MTSQKKGYNKDPECSTRIWCRFNMDYGFVRGKDTIKNEDGPLITSNDGYNCYLMTIDKYSRYTWLFLFADKSPHIDTIKTFLNTHSLKDGLRQVRKDQRGELSRSTKFRKTILDAGHTLELTGVGPSF